MAAITMERCRAEYLLVAVEDDGFRKPKNDDFRKTNDDDFRMTNDDDFTKDDDDFREVKNDILRGSGKNISDAIFDQDDSWHSRDQDDYLEKNIPKLLKAIIKVIHWTGWDKITKTKLEFDQMKLLGLGTVFIEILNIERLADVKFEDMGVTPTDRNKKRKLKATFVFPRLELTGKVIWTKGWFNGLYLPPDVRGEEVSFSGVIKNLKIKTVFPIDVLGGTKVMAKFEEITDLVVPPSYEIENFQHDGNWDKLTDGIMGKFGCSALVAILQPPCPEDSNTCQVVCDMSWLKNYLRTWILDEQFKNILNGILKGKTVLQLGKEYNPFG